MSRRVAAIVLVALVVASPALANSPLGIGNAEVAVQSGAGSVFRALAALQQDFFADLRQALVAMKNGSGGGLSLVALSFAYGVFHAAGPGHGKAVISSYMLSNEVELRRGVVLSFASALVQALAALVLVAAGWFVLRGSAVSMTEAGRALELLSYGLIAAFGGCLLAVKLAAAVRRRQAIGLATGALAFADAGSVAPGLMRPASGGFSSDVCADPAGGQDCDCGRAHIVDPRALSGERLGLCSGASAVLAVGLRPCTGAIVVLTFALVNGLLTAGVLSVLAMALGTAITVSLLACLAVFAKDVALRFGGGRAGQVREAVEILGAVLLLALGLGLLYAGVAPAA